jgi:hypothetical protein
MLSRFAHEHRRSPSWDTCHLWAARIEKFFAERLPGGGPSRLPGQTERA